DILHVVAMSVWLGGLFVLVVDVLGSDDPARARGPAVRFSPIATAAVATLIVTGAFAVLRQVPHFSDLLHTGYGRLLLVKLAAFAALLLVALAARSIVRFELGADIGSPEPTPFPPGPGAKLAEAAPGELPPEQVDTVRRLRNATVFEIGFAVVVLASTSLLVGAAPPATSSPQHAY